MPKKITNYLKEGLPSKIYLRAYPEPISRYRISKELYPDVKTTSSKIIEHSKKLIEKGYLLAPKKDRILSDVNPLIREIENNLKQKEITLTEQEKKDLAFFLNKDLRDFLKTIDKKEFNGNNAYSVLSYFIGFIATNKLLLYDSRLSDFENIKIPYKNGTPEQFKLIVENELNKEVLIKLKEISPFNFSSLIDFLKKGIECYQINEEQLLKNNS